MIAALLFGGGMSQAYADFPGLESSYRFLVNDRASAGILYTADAGNLRDKQLPLSFIDSPAYWGRHICRSSKDLCAVVDTYNPQTYTLTPQNNDAGDLQTERINIHNGANIYDAATWQIAVMLGSVVNQFKLPDDRDAYTLAGNQNQLLREGYSGNANHPVAGQNRATSNGQVFVYNGQPITDNNRAYTFRTLPRSWLSEDPFIGTAYAQWITASALPVANPQYRNGVVSWTDWKPISGENAWAFLIGPLQAAYIHYVIDKRQGFVPFQDLAVQNAINLLPTFAAMQAPLGAVYYAPAGTVKNIGTELVNRYEVAVENSFSLYAGLKILRATLQAELARQTLGEADRAIINNALQLSAAMIDGGTIGTPDSGGSSNSGDGANKEKLRHTAGLLAFFKNSAWRDGEFVQGGLANDPASKSTNNSDWLPTLEPRAIDVNTWGIAALGAKQIDAWFGSGAAYQNWQRIKSWGAYGNGKVLWGVGFSNRDDNGIDANGNYRQGILSAEWTAGAINMLRAMIEYYQTVKSATAQNYVEALRRDEQAMLAALQKLRIDNYPKTTFPGQPQNYAELLPLPTRPSSTTLPYLYASKRYLIPFGWYANPLPSTCSTAWIMMLANRYDPFVYGGGYDGKINGER